MTLVSTWRLGIQTCSGLRQKVLSKSVIRHLGMQACRHQPMSVSKVTTATNTLALLPLLLAAPHWLCGPSLYFSPTHHRLCFFSFFFCSLNRLSVTSLLYSQIHQNVFRADVSRFHFPFLPSFYPSTPPLLFSLSVSLSPPLWRSLGSPFLDPRQPLIALMKANQLIQLHCHQARRCPGMNDSKPRLIAL